MSVHTESEYDGSDYDAGDPFIDDSELVPNDPLSLSPFGLLISVKPQKTWDLTNLNKPSTYHSYQLMQLEMDDVETELGGFYGSQ